MGTSEASSNPDSASCPTGDLAAGYASPSYRPLGLIAELTYKCPLHCPYCSNPIQSPFGLKELTTDEWRRVLAEAAGLGTLHALFSGGEPLVRSDLADLVHAARSAGMYTNLITSAVGLTRSRAEQLKSAGLDSIQISFQDHELENADRLAGATAHALKIDAAKLVRDLGFPLTVNVVLHRENIDRLDAIIAFAETLWPIRLELASTQFYGWALRNRDALLPTLEQVARAERVAMDAKSRLASNMEVLYVPADYFGDRPKPCMNGWGRRYIAINPFGDVLPCPTALEIRSLKFDNVRDHHLGWIWRDSAAFNAYRGTAWMPEPCRSCDRREIDFGGCRCQAAIVTGDPASTDPACGLAPHRQRLVETITAAPRERRLVQRVDPSRAVQADVRGAP